MRKYSSVKIAKNPCLKAINIDLPSSKSESNRALIINSFAGGKLHNLSEARDTQTMMRLLKSEAHELDVLDAGTTMRFLLAYLVATGKQKVLTGTPRMCERPIGILAAALKALGADLEYLKNEGFPPLAVKGFAKQKNAIISMRGDVSSQYISAMMMIAPMLPKGLTIKLEGKIASKPYIEMTLALMKKFGAETSFTDQEIIIAPSGYQPSEFTVESDWSGASYWFSLVSLADKADIVLTGLKETSLQGDNRIMEIMAPLGVKSTFSSTGLQLQKQPHENMLRYDFRHCPDLAQTVAVTCAAKGIRGEFSGLESLRIKETDRISALQNELTCIGAQLIENDPHSWTLIPAEKSWKNHEIFVHTYDDHRMAMAFAPLATQAVVEIEDPAATDKSYPSFWKHLQKAGFKLEFVSR